MSARISFAKNPVLIGEQPSRTSILLVEDNVDLNLAMCEILESCGFDIISAENGLEDLKHFKYEFPMSFSATS